MQEGALGDGERPCCRGCAGDNSRARMVGVGGKALRNVGTEPCIGDTGRERGGAGVTLSRKAIVGVRGIHVEPMEGVRTHA